MARNIGPQCRLCRQEEVKVYLKGDRCKSDKCPITKRRGKPGEGLRARIKKASDYSVQLREKQKVKRLYGMLENQFHIFFIRAQRLKGVTGDNLIAMLERRLDNMVYRMHFAPSRKAADRLRGRPTWIVKPLNENSINRVDLPAIAGSGRSTRANADVC